MRLIVFDQIGCLFAGKKRRPPSVTKFAGIAVERHPRIIGDLLAAAGQRIEQRSLAAVRRATNAKWKVPAIMAGELVITHDAADYLRGLALAEPAGNPDCRPVEAAEGASYRWPVPRDGKT